MSNRNGNTVADAASNSGSGDSVSEVNSNNANGTNPEAILEEVKTLDANKYATKKTVAQGMLDIALLTSNASQLKYVLQVGAKHEFYTLLVVLISISIVLQLIVGLLFVLIGGLNLNEDGDQPSALVLNDVIVMIIFAISVLGALVAVVLGYIFNINHQPDQRKAELINDILLGFKGLVLAINVGISIFYSMHVDMSVTAQ